MNVLYYCPSVGMYGDNIALMNIMPFLIKSGVNPYFVVPLEGPFTKHLSELGYFFYVSNYRESNNYDINSRPLWTCIKKGVRLYLNRHKRNEAINAICSWCNMFNISIVHTNSSNNNIGLQISHCLSVPHVWHFREFIRYNLNLEYWPNRFLFRNIYMQSKNNHIIFITPELYKYWKSPSNGITIYDGVVTLANGIPDISKKKKQQFLFVGRLTEDKGIERVISSFQKIATSNIETKLLVVGTGSKEYEEKLKKNVAQAGLEMRIRFLGYREDVQSIMKESQAIIVATTFEAFGFITAEAMFNGCLVIGYNTGGTKLQLDNGAKVKGREIGLRYNNDTEMEERMRTVLDQNIDYQMLEDAQSVVLSLYSAENSAKKVYQLYESIVHK